MNLNQVMIIGHVSQAPVIKEYQTGKILTRFNVATNYKRKGKSPSEQTEFHTVVAFGKLAEVCRDYITKGRLVCVQGRLHTSRWEDKNKVAHFSTDVIANDMMLLDKKQEIVNAARQQNGEDDTEVVVDLSQQYQQQMA